MNNRTVILPALGLSLLLAGCARGQQTPMTDLLRNSTDQVSLEAPETIETGTDTRLVFRVTKDGKAPDLDQELRMFHVVIASENSDDIVHVPHAETVEPGTQALTHAFALPGRYRVWIEIDDTQAELRHGANADLIAYADLTVTGEPGTPSIIREHAQTVTVDGYVVSIEPVEIHAGEPAILHIGVRDIKGKDMLLPEFDPVLYAITGRKLEFFEHGHMHGQADGHAESDPIVFPVSGDYTLLAQIVFFDRGEVRELETHVVLPVLD